MFYYPKLAIVVKILPLLNLICFLCFILLFIIKPGIIIDKQYHILYSLFDPQIVCFWPIYHKTSLLDLLCYICDLSICNLFVVVWLVVWVHKHEYNQNDACYCYIPCLQCTTEMFCYFLHYNLSYLVSKLELVTSNFCGRQWKKWWKAYW